MLGARQKTLCARWRPLVRVTVKHFTHWEWSFFSFFSIYCELRSHMQTLGTCARYGIQNTRNCVPRALIAQFSSILFLSSIHSFLFFQSFLFLFKLYNLASLPILSPFSSQSCVCGKWREGLIERIFSLCLSLLYNTSEVVFLFVCQKEYKALYLFYLRETPHLQAFLLETTRDKHNQKTSN